MAGSNVKRENHITIHGWMVCDLGLKGNELLIYAIIYGFSQTDGQVYHGSLQYMADWTNSTKQGVLKAIKALLDKGYIIKNEKIINGVKFCEYYATEFNTLLNSVERGIKQSLTGGIKQSLTNNIIEDNIEDNIDNKKENILKEKRKIRLYGEYQNVKLTDDDLEKLKSEFPQDWELRINNLSYYLKSTGKTYKDHLATIRCWARKEGGNGKLQRNDRQNPPVSGSKYGLKSEI